MFVNLYRNHDSKCLNFPTCFCVYVFILFNLNVTSFNCHGIGTSIETIRQLTTEFEIVFLEETWIYPDEFAIVSQISDEMQSFSLSSMSLDEKLLSGRPHGGLSVMWKKSLSNLIKIMQFDDSRILGIELQSNNFTLLFLTVYLPYECDKFYDDYCFYLSKLQCIIDSANTPYVFILGDFNADIQNTSIFGAELLDFCDNNTLCFLDKEFLSPDSFTNISQAHGTTSWLDHCITTTSGKSITSGVSIIDNIVCSDHFPLCIDLVCDINPLCDTVTDVNYQPKLNGMQLVNLINNNIV